MDSDWQKVERVFEAALELPVAERSAYVAAACGDDAAIRAEVESLLAAHQRSGRFLDADLASALPVSIGRYRIIRLIGEGAMGTVYEAEQEQPRRTVALKVIKPGLAGPELLRRFDRESEALARLQHPGIAQVYEAGTAEGAFGARPYFAMEFIRGESLLQYAQARHAGTRRRLELVAEICDAVQHAHQRGVIHRDLKPGNILVDESGHPKILDFGVARLTDRDARVTRETDIGHLVGTLAYMSPEQVLADPMELDTRSDVYALGVILFELLSGRLPYELSRQLHEAIRTIRLEDPARLSSINRTFRGDIETIVAKALEKDRARRYSSAADLATDIRRYLSDEPIVARPASAAYQMRKFARRHTALVAGVGTVFAVLLAGIVTTTWQAALARRAEQEALHDRDRAAIAERTASRERDRALTAERAATSGKNRAVAAEAQAIHEKNRALDEKHRADTEAATARAIDSFLKNDLLAQASASVQARPGTKPDPDLKVRTALDRAAARISGKFDQQPVVEASIRQTIGEAYGDLGLYPEAQRQLEHALELRQRALGDRHRDTMGTMKTLAGVYQSQGKYAQAGTLYVQLLELQRRVLGDENADTVSTMNDLGTLYRYQGKFALAQSLFVKSLEVEERLLGEEHRDTMLSMNNLALVYYDQAKYAQAEPLYLRARNLQRRVLGEEHPDTLLTMNNLSLLYQAEGKLAEAEPLFTRVLEIRRRVLGEEHPSTLLSMNNLAVLYRNLGKYAQAEQLYTKALEVQRRVLGEEHPNTLRSMSNLGVLYLRQGKHASAEPLLTRVLEIRRRVIGQEHPDTLLSINNLALLYLDRGELAEAEPLFVQAFETRRRVLGEEHPDSLVSMNNLAALYRSQGKYTEAEPLCAKVLEIRRRMLGPEHLETTNALAALGHVRMGQKKYAEAESLLSEAFHFHEKKNADGWQRYDVQSMLGASLALQARFTEAEPLLLAGYHGLVQRKGNIPIESRFALEQAGDRIVQLYRDWGNAEKAAEWRKKLRADSSLLQSEQQRRP
jgi:eukaryotic-like serine/threonine-protein kinase